MTPTSSLKPKHDPLLGIHAVTRLSSLSRTTIYRLIAAGKFPQAIELSTRRVAWRESDVLRWVAAPMEWGLMGEDF